MQKEVIETYNQFRESFIDNPDFVINFFSERQTLFSSIQKFESVEILNSFSQMAWHFLKAMYQKGRYNQVINFANQLLNSIESESIRLHGKTSIEYWHNGILHFKGMAAYQLRDFKTSTPIFRYLAKLDPESDNFKIWLNLSRYGQSMWLVRLINIVCGITLLIYVLSKNHIQSFEVRISLLLIACIGFVVNWSYEYYKKRSIRRFKEAT